MESYLSKSTKESLDKLIDSIIKSDEYKKSLELKEKMNNDKDLMNLIDEVRVLQKKYIRSNYDKTIKEELDNKNEILNKNLLYNEYNYYLDIVNQKINIIKDELNNYFYDITNKELLDE